MLTTTHPPRPAITSDEPRGRLWRSRWAAIGAAVAVTVGAGGVVGFANAASSVPSDIVAITPVRVLDTRDPVNLGLNGPFVSATGLDLTVAGNIPTADGPQVVVPPGATSVLLNVTVVNPKADGFISVRPADAPGAPSTSNLNFKAGETTPNSVTVQVPAAGADAGKIELTYDALGTAGPTADILVDVMGYTQAAPAAVRTTFFTVVDANGVTVRSSPGPVTSGSTVILGNPIGRYAVGFSGADISQCAYQVTVGEAGTNLTPLGGFATVASSATPASALIVSVRDENGVPIKRGFHLTVTC